MFLLCLKYKFVLPRDIPSIPTNHDKLRSLNCAVSFSRFAGLGFCKTKNNRVGICGHGLTVIKLRTDKATNNFETCKFGFVEGGEIVPFNQKHKASSVCYSEQGSQGSKRSEIQCRRPLF